MDKPKKAEIAAIRKIITELPKGNVSPKTISGKVRYYLQWSEDGVEQGQVWRLKLRYM